MLDIIIHNTRLSCKLNPPDQSCEKPPEQITSLLEFPSLRKNITVILLPDFDTVDQLHFSLPKEGQRQRAKSAGKACQVKQSPKISLILSTVLYPLVLYRLRKIRTS